jgi:hypothetical protein
VTLPADPGFQAPPGDAGQLHDAARWHSNLADGLDAHAATIAGSAASLAPVWEGNAASSYQALSGMITGHFRNAAGTSRMAAASLRRYASELERCQREGTHALSEAQHWLAKGRADQVKLTAAQNAVSAAQGEVSGAQMSVMHAANVVGPGAAGVAATASSQLRAAQAKLTQAQTDERNAQQMLTDDEHQFVHWQTRGRQAWQEAVTAAETATGSLEPLSVAPPPLAAGMAFPLFSGSPADWYGLGAGAFGGYWTTVATGNLAAARSAVQNLFRRYGSFYDASRNPNLSAAERAAAAENADALAPEIRSVVASEPGLTGAVNFGERILGYGLGGLGDAGIRIASGENVAQSAAQGTGAAIGGYAVGGFAASACAGSGFLAPIAPLCGAAGGAAGGLAGDVIGGAVESVLSEL